MDASSQDTNARDAAPTVTAATAATAGTAATAITPVNPTADQTANKPPPNTIEHESQPQKPSQNCHLGQIQIAQRPSPNQTPIQPNPNQQNPAAQQRRRVMERDRYNYQSLGPSLNSAVKQVRLVLISPKRCMRSAS